MPEPRLALIVLAAGEGKRMRSRLPKPLHPVAGKPMLSHVLAAGAAANPAATVLVVGRETADLAARLGLAEQVTSVIQDPPRGTGDAVRQALAAFPGAGETHLAVVFADNPLLTGEVVRRLVDGAVGSGALVTLMTAEVPGGAGYGRIVRRPDGAVAAIIERKDDPSARTGPVEVNSGLMVLDAAWARRALPRLTPSQETGELYLTELVALANAAPARASGPAVHAVTVDAAVAFGVNDRRELAAAEALLRARIRDELFAAGVTIIAPETVVIDSDVTIGPDTTIHPFSYLQPGTVIGRDCVIGPHAVIAGSRLGDRVTVRASTVVGAEIGDDSDVGPYSHLRPGTRLGRHVHIGNFGELKNAQLADNVKSGHVSYLGDVTVGPAANIGAGTITANYDGHRKHQTTIGAAAFIGSDSILRAPVTIGDGAVIGAGSVVTKDIPAGALAVGLPARVVRQAAAQVAPTVDQPTADQPNSEEG